MASFCFIQSFCDRSWLNSVLSKSVYSQSKYCICPSRTCCLIAHMNISLWFVHFATFLQKSIWHRSGSCLLKFSVHPNMMNSHTGYCALFQTLFWPLLLEREALQKFNNSPARPCNSMRSSAFIPNFLHCILYSTTAKCTLICVISRTFYQLCAI